MKKIIITLALSSCTFLFAQKSESYLKLSYNSICCGTPSTAPVMTYIEKFQGKSKAKNIEIFRQSGLGREGEFALYLESTRFQKARERSL
jgi:hypothetical protein